MIRRFIPIQFKKSISRKLIFLILLFSSLITLFMTGLQLWLEFRGDINEIEHRLQDIDKSFSQTIAQQIWNLDREQMQITASGLFQLPYVDYVSIAGSDMKPVIFGDESNEDYKLYPDRHIKLKRDLFHDTLDTKIGQLTICTSLEPVIQKLKNKVLITLATQGVKTFLVSLFMLIVFNLLVVRHLVNLAQVSDKINLDELNTNPFPERDNPSGDEIDIVMSSFNLMLSRLRENYDELRSRESSLKKYKDELEETIERRTFQLKAAKMSAEQANEAKSLFLASMSHELRTPLNSIILLSGILAKNPNSNLSPEQIKQAQVINRAGKELLTLVSDVLDLSRIEAGKLKLEHDDFELRELVEHISDLYSPLAMQKGIEFKVDIAHPCPIRTDRDKLSQIVKNIVGNAIKFTSKGNVEVRLTYNQGDDRGEYCLEVLDTGIGMAPDSIQLIFNRFQQANKNISSEFGGTGLGLAISKKLAKILAITIEVESTPEQGSCFKLYIPSPYQVEHEVFNADSTHIKKSEKLEGKLVAIIDDDERNLFTLQSLLEVEKIEVDRFSSGVSFLSAVERGEKWDFILLDLMMPEMDGYEVFEHLKRLNVQAPVLLVTAATDPKQRRRAQEVGFKAFIPKPIDLQLLIDELDKNC